MDLLDALANEARERAAAGYYEAPPKAATRAPSLARAISSAPRAILAEVKPASPVHGRMLASSDPESVASALSRSGARGLSILTEPDRFRGSLRTLWSASSLGVPTLMKDFFVCEAQMRAARECGASAVLLIATIFSRGGADRSLPEAVDLAKRYGLETIVEAASRPEFEWARSTGAELLGINNRDLRTMEVDLGKTARILSSTKKDRPVVGMSGVESRKDADELFRAGCDAVLVGSSLMSAPDPAAKLQELL